VMPLSGWPLVTLLIFIASAPSACAPHGANTLGNRIFKHLAPSDLPQTTCPLCRRYPTFDIHLQLRAGMRAAIRFRIAADSISDDVNRQRVG
jgi:hypothetical protein